MLEKIRKSLRITSTNFDDEIQDLIDSAKVDMKISGVEVINEEDPLIKRAIDFYCKANFYIENKDADRYQKRYEELIKHLSLAGDYKANEWDYWIRVL